MLSATQPASQPTSASTTQWSRPRFEERQAERDRMVEEQIAHPRDGRPPVRDPRVLEAMRRVPRHLFVRHDDQTYAYTDFALPIGYDQTISQPYIVACMTELLALPPGGRVLEVGTGSGYQAAVLAEITPHVYTIEIVEPLAASARERLARLGYRAVQVRAGDGYFGWPEAAPFDGIIVPCAADAVPDAMWEQLRPGGRIVIPLGQAGQIQELTVIAKHPDGSRSASRTIPCAFVPMTGAAQDRP